MQVTEAEEEIYKYEFWLRSYIDIAIRYPMKANVSTEMFPFGTMTHDHYATRARKCFDLFKIALENKLLQSSNFKVYELKFKNSFLPIMNNYVEWYNNHQEEIENYGDYNPYHILMNIIESTFLLFNDYFPEMHIDGAKNILHWLENDCGEYSKDAYGKKAETVLDTLNEEKREIIIQNDAASKLYEGLKEYFQGRENDLKSVLNGEVISTPLFFPLEQNRLAELIKRVYYNGGIQNDKKKITNWLCKNFTFKWRGEIKQLNNDTVYNIFKAGGRIAKSKRLLLNDFPYNS